MNRRLKPSILVAAVLFAGQPALGQTANGTPELPIARAVPVDSRAIVLLPFAVRGPKNLEYLGDGMAELLQGAVDEMGGYRIVDRRSVLRRIPGSESPTPTAAMPAARSLGAGLVLGGSIVAIGDGLRVSAELVDVSLGKHTPGRASVDVADLARIADSLISVLLPGSPQRPSDKTNRKTYVVGGRMAPDEVVLVLDFASAPQDSSLARLVADAVRIGIDQSGVVRTMPPGSVSTALQQMRRAPTERVTLPVGLELARRSNVKAVVDGELSRAGDMFLLVTRLVNAETGNVLANATATAATIPELPRAAEDLSRRLRLKIGESLDKVQQGAHLEAVTTASFEALELYMRGARANDVEANYPKAVDLLRQAVALDSTFAMAWRKLAVALVSGNIGTVQQFQDASGRAFRLRDRLTETERLAVEGIYYVQKNFAKQLNSAEELWRRRPNPADSSGVGNLAGLLFIARDFPRAEALLSGMVRAHPADVNYSQLVQALLQQGKMRQADSMVSLAMTRAPARNGLLRTRFTCGYGEIAECERLLDSVRNAGKPGQQLDVLNLQSTVALLRGQIARADRLWREQQQLGEARGIISRSPGPMAVYRADGIDLFIRQNPVPVGPRLDSIVGEIRGDVPFAEMAKHYAWGGRTTNAREMLARARALQRDDDLAGGLKAKMAAAEAVILLAEGRWRDAIPAFRTADALPYSDNGSCTTCLFESLATAYERGNMPDSALVMYERSLNGVRFPAPDWGRPTTLEAVCRLADGLGRRDKALQYCQQFIDAWKDADDELQPRVAEARRRLARARGPSESGHLHTSLRRVVPRQTLGLRQRDDWIDVVRR